MDKRQHYTAADRRPTSQVSAWQAERESRQTRRHILARIFARKLLSWNLSFSPLGKLPEQAISSADGVLKCNFLTVDFLDS